MKDWSTAEVSTANVGCDWMNGELDSQCGPGLVFLWFLSWYHKFFQVVLFWYYSGSMVGTSSTQNGPRGLVGWKIAENPWGDEGQQHPTFVSRNEAADQGKWLFSSLSNCEASPEGICSILGPMAWERWWQSRGRLLNQQESWGVFSIRGNWLCLPQKEVKNVVSVIVNCLMGVTGT